MTSYVKGMYLNKLPSADSYLCKLPLVKNLYYAGEIRLNSNVTFLVGENGTGKSTLLEAIAVAMGFNAEGGTRNFSFSTNRTHSELHNLITVIKGVRPRDGFFLRAESFYNVASYIDYIDKIDPTMIQSYGGTSLHEQSHGESFLSLMKYRFGGNGLYLLDEPEAALSPSRQMTMLILMKQLLDKKSQFIIATHSPIIMSFPNAQVIELTENGINNVSYRETEHFKLTKLFLDNPEKVLGYLLDE